MSSSFAVTSAEFNGTTYASGSGGVIRVQVSHVGDPLADWTGADEYPQQVNVVNKRLIVRLFLREVKIVTALGTKDTSSSFALVIKSDTVSVTCVNMVLVGVDMDQGKSEYGTTVLTLMHESADGTTVPIS